jgi:hypothetical protein
LDSTGLERINGGLYPVRSENSSEFHEEATNIMTNFAVAGVSSMDTAA